MGFLGRAAAFVLNDFGSESFVVKVSKAVYGGLGNRVQLIGDVKAWLLYG
jgi:hypothetical protein